VGGAGGKGSGSQGDEAEKRLKHEVMHMARRERKRLKTIHDDGWDPFYQEMLDMADAKKIHIPENVSASAGGHGNLSEYSFLRVGRQSGWRLHTGLRHLRAV
jgi:transcriptional coactivator HFI1/ADA1